MPADDAQALWSEAAAELSAGRPVALTTIVRSTGSVPRRAGSRMLVYSDGRTAGSVGGGLFEELVRRDAMQAMKAGESRIRSYSFNPEGAAPDAFGAVCGGKAEVFVDVSRRAETLLVVGGGHCGRALAELAGKLGFHVVVADEREEFVRAEDAPFQGVAHLVRVAPDFHDLPEPDERTFVAIMTRGFETDAAALRRVLSSPAAYIGMIGSRKKRQVVYRSLAEQGVEEAALERVHAPIGLEIGAETPMEIAVSVLAEIIQVRAGGRKPA